MTSTKKIYLKAKTFYPFNQVLEFILANLLLSLVIMFAFMNNPLQSASTFFIALGWAFAICSTQWLGHGYIFHYLDKKISWIEQPVKRAIWGLVALVIYSAVAFFFIQMLFYYLVNGTLPNVTLKWIIGSVFYPVGISFVITLTFTAVGFFRAWKASAVKAEKLNTEMMAYKYEVLRNQINPHFLFNSLNALSDLVYEDQELAVKFIQRLSNLFRYVLDSRDKELVPLSEEIEFVKSFVYLLKSRFDDKLVIDMELEAGEDELIVPVSIQMLLENAVKHNEVSDAFPLKIKVRKVNGYIEISNSLKAKSADDASTKLGIRNLKQQFAFFTDKEIKISKTQNTFVVSVPLIQSQTKTA
jgi:two-component system, LytTR family, sensor kinase